MSLRSEINRRKFFGLPIPSEQELVVAERAEEVHAALSGLHICSVCGKEVSSVDFILHAADKEFDGSRACHKCVRHLHKVRRLRRQARNRANSRTRPIRLDGPRTSCLAEP